MKKISMNSEQVQQHQQEVKALQKLNHPNIIKFFESFVYQDKLCIVMEYAQGGDLQKRIKMIKQKDKQIKDTYFSELQLCDALFYLHQRNIIHRDLKAQNVFLNEDEDIILGDFGICRQLNSTNDFASTFVGTPYNFSPELIQNQLYNQKSDYWGLGCILYELCTLERPFEGEHIVLVIENILKTTPKRIPKIYSPELQMVIDMLLTKDPNQRASISDIFNRADVQKYKNLIDVVRNVNPRSLRQQFEINLSPVTKEKEAESPQNSTANFQQCINQSQNQENNPRKLSDYTEQQIIFDQLDNQEEQKEEQENLYAAGSSPVTESVIKAMTQNKKPYQREIQIDVASLDKQPYSQKSNSLQKCQPSSAPSTKQKPSTPTEISSVKAHTKKRKNSSMTDKELKLKNDLSTKTVGTQGKIFTFSESILKKAPRSPNRRMLMQDYIKQKLGEQKFFDVAKIIKESGMEASEFLKERAEEIINIVGLENLSIIDVGIDFGAFNMDIQQKISPKFQTYQNRQDIFQQQHQALLQHQSKSKKNNNKKQK